MMMATDAWMTTSPSVSTFTHESIRNVPMIVRNNNQHAIHYQLGEQQEEEDAAGRLPTYDEVTQLQSLV